MWCHFGHPAWCHAFRTCCEICESYGKQLGFDSKTPKNTDFMQETDIADPFKERGVACYYYERCADGKYICEKKKTDFS